MKPCDCHDMETVNKLNEQGIRYNSTSIEIKPPNVILEDTFYSIKISQNKFKRFAEWYLEDQMERVLEEDEWMEEFK